MTVPSIKVKVVRRPQIKVKTLVKFPANVVTQNFLTVTNSGGTYTFSVDYSRLGPGPIINPTTAFVAVSDTTAGVYKTVTLDSLLTSGLDADLQAIAALAGAGILVKTAANTWAFRTATGTANEITVTNGDGVAGNPTLSLPSSLTFTGKTITNGTYVTPALGTPTALVLTNATGLPISGLTTQAAFTFVGNNTSGSAIPTAVDIHTLTLKASPAATDEVIISDQAASGAWKRSPVSSLASASGVSSIAGNTGAFTLAGGVTNSTNQVQLDGNYTGWAIPNCSLAASVAANILTVALKDNTGADASATSPIFINYRNVTAATGSTSLVTQTAALSITTNATGATLGSLSNTAFRFWVVVFNNAGTNVLALFNATSAVATTPTIFPINEGVVASSTAMSGSATSAGVFYTPNGTTITSKAFRILGYVEYNSTGLTTAGTYATGPNFIQTFGPGIRKPGDEVQRITNIAGTSSTTTTIIPQDNTIPQITEGKEFLNVTLTPSSAANVIEIDSRMMGACSAGDTVTAALFRDATANALTAMAQSNAANFMSAFSMHYMQQAAGIASTIYRLRAGPAVGTTTFTFNGQSGAQLYGGVAGSSMIAIEIMG